MAETNSYYELVLEKDGLQAESDLLIALQQSGIFKSCYAHKSRVKSEKQLVEKVLRKKKEKPDYLLQSITDVVGIRFVTLFRNDMPLIFKDILSIINHEHGLDPNPFLKGGLEEVIIFYTSPNDHIRHKIKSIALKNNIGVKIEENLSPEEYSSIHLVARLKKRVESLESNDTKYFIPVEIQIRTVFEDAWGEIDHKFGYVSRTGKDVGTPIANPDNVLHHLKVMKKFSDACAEYADAILMEATPKPEKVTDNSKILSVLADDEIISTIRELGVDPVEIDIYSEARKLRTDGETLENIERGNGLELFLQSAELFRELATKYETEDIVKESRKNYIFYYYVKMNESLCLLRTNRQEYVNIAHSSYEDLLVCYPDFPLLMMRYGQACGKLGMFNEALINFGDANKCIAKFEDEGKIFNDSVPIFDYEHIKAHLPKVYGYYLWKIADTIDDSMPDQALLKLDLLAEAYNITKNSLEINPDKAKLHNNMLYYAVTIAEICSRISVDEKYCHIVDSIGAHLLEIENVCDIETCEDIDFLDTLLNAYDYLGRVECLNIIISRIVPIAERALSASPCDRDVMLQIQSTAIKLKMKYGCY